MNIFEKRPLALVLCTWLGGFFLFSTAGPILRAVLIILSFLPLVFPLFLRISKNAKTTLRLIGIALLFSYLLSFSYFDNYFNLHDKYTESVKIIGVVEEIKPTTYGRSLLIRVESIDDKPDSGHKILAYPTAKYDDGIIEWTRVSFTARLTSFSDESRQYNYSRGISSIADDMSDVQILEYNAGGIASTIAKIRQCATRYIISVSNQETGGIVCALLLGERDLLSDSLRLDFKRIGISHILALSGMHLAILSIGIGKLLTILKIRKKARLIIIGAFIIIYMALTGFSVSVCRAGIMLLISYALFLLCQSYDSITSLSIAVSLICLVTPYAIFSTSLWLSALATLGIIVLSEIRLPKQKKDGLLYKIGHYALLSMLASVFAISGTICVSTFTFGGFSILAPFATLIFSIICEIIMYLGCVMILVGWMLPIRLLIAPLVKLLTFLASALSSIDFSYVSSNFDIAKVVIIIYTVLFFGFIIIKVGKKDLALKILLLTFVFSMTLPTVLTHASQTKETLLYSSGSKADIMLIRSENEVCLINSAVYSKNTAYDVLDVLESQRVTRLDKYYLTHYSWSLDEEIGVLCSNIKVEEILLPSPRNDDEKLILKIIQKSTEGCKTKIITFEENKTVEVGEYQIRLLYSEPYGKTSMNAFSVTRFNETYLYLSAGMLESKDKARYFNYINESDYVIFGEHGKKYKSKIYLDTCYEKPKMFIMHSDSVFLKQENYKYMLDRGCEIYSHPEEIIYFINQ